MGFQSRRGNLASYPDVLPATMYRPIEATALNLPAGFRNRFRQLLSSDQPLFQQNLLKGFELCVLCNHAIDQSLNGSSELPQLC